MSIADIRRENDGAVQDLDVTVSCSSGTYIRALARDLGAALGVGGGISNAGTLTITASTLSGNSARAGGGGAEERRPGLDAALARHRADVRRRLDAEHRDARLAKVLQQIAVVAGDLDDLRLRAEAQAR